MERRFRSKTKRENIFSTKEGQGLPLISTELAETLPKGFEEIFPVAFKHKSGGIFIWDDDRDRYLDLKGYGEYWTYDRSFFDSYPKLIQELYWSESDIPRERDWEVVGNYTIGGEIQAVKWLPTGEVFGVGDWVQWESYTAGWFKPEKIVRFVIREDFCSAEFESSPNRMQIKDLRKADPPTLITEDGKPFWKGDKAVWINDYGLENLEEIDTSRLALKPQVGVGYDKYFSAIEAAKDYIEAAKDYIEQNSRKYSLKEIEEVLINDGFSSGAVDKVIDKLKALDR